MPLQRIPNKDKDKEVVSTQWEMGDVEKAGLLKMDFLGLRNLTSLDGRRPAHRADRPAQPIDLHDLPLDDARDLRACSSAARPRASSSSTARASATCS